MRQYNNQQFAKILDFLKTDGITTGMLKSSGTFKKAVKRLQKYESQIERLLVDEQNDVPGTMEKLKNKWNGLSKPGKFALAGLVIIVLLVVMVIVVTTISQFTALY